jgi:hypothetical protein
MGMTPRGVVVAIIDQYHAKLSRDPTKSKKQAATRTERIEQDGVVKPPTREA